jgi:phosphonatase-like hydrolase
MHPHGPIDLVVFDVAGTTVRDDDDVVGVLQSTLATRDVTVPRASVIRVMGLPKPLSIRLLLAEARGHEPDDFEVLAAHADFVEKMIDHYARSASVCEIEGARRAFHRLRASGVKVALDTGFSREILETILERLDWRIGEDLDVTVTSDEVEHGRPLPDMILRAMELAHVTDPHRVAKVGDTPADLLSGAAAHCGMIVGVTSGACDADELRPHPHTHLLPNVGLVAALVVSRRGPARGGRAPREWQDGARSRPARPRAPLSPPGPHPRRAPRP